MKRIPLIGFLLLVGLAVFGAIAPVRQAVSQAGWQALLTMISTDKIEVNRFGSAIRNYATPPMITSQSGYAKYTPITGFSYTFGNYQSWMALNPSGTVSAGTVVLGPSPSDGARECVFTTNTVTSLTLNANTNQSINNAVTTLLADTGACYLYSLSNKTWDRD